MPAAPTPPPAPQGEASPLPKTERALLSKGDILIKENVKRSVLRTSGVGGQLFAHKVFHAPGLGRFRDRGRAKGEARMTRSAHAAGLPVPDGAVAIKRRGRWIYQSDWIETDGSLGDLLQGPWPGERIRRSTVACALGKLLSQCMTAGFVHGDPHPGNLLVEPNGRIRIVDLHGSRLGRPTEEVLTSIAKGAGALRETNGRFLISVYRAWRNEVSAVGGAPPPAPTQLDGAARRHRLAATARRLRVWRRSSTPTVLTEEEGRPLIRVRAHGQPPAEWESRRVDFESSQASSAAWDHLVRAKLHHLPAALPTGLFLQAPWQVEMALPPGAVEVAAPPSPQLDALLRHRGLQVHGPLLQRVDGSQMLGPRTVLAEGPDA